MLFISKKCFIFMLALGLCFNGKTLGSELQKADRFRKAVERFRREEDRFRKEEEDRCRKASRSRKVPKKIPGNPKADINGEFYTVSFFNSPCSAYFLEARDPKGQCKEFFCVINNMKEGQKSSFVVKTMGQHEVSCTQEQAEAFYKQLERFKLNIDYERSKLPKPLPPSDCYYTTAGVMSEFKKRIGIQQAPVHSSAEIPTKAEIPTNSQLVSHEESERERLRDTMIKLIYRETGKDHSQLIPSAEDLPSFPNFVSGPITLLNYEESESEALKKMIIHFSLQK